jgi:hypothetical protein
VFGASCSVLALVVKDDYVHSFSVVFQGLLEWLVELKREGRLGPSLCFLIDSTFKVEWLGYTWGSTGLVLWRQVAGRWRKTFVPLILRCVPRETGESYHEQMQLLQELLVSNDLPPPGQIGCACLPDSVSEPVGAPRLNVYDLLGLPN